MLKNVLTIDGVIEFLNSLVKIDREAMERLVESRVPCNQDLLNHSTVQVTDYEYTPKVGLLGILNGLFGTFSDGPKEGWGPITVVMEDDGSLVEFRRTENK